MRHFATIVTSSHVGYARVLLSSLRRHAEEQVLLHVVVVDDRDPRMERPRDPPGFVRHPMQELHGEEHFAAIVERYGSSDLDALRWSLKPVFLRHLLQGGEADAVAFVDPDQYFVGDPAVLFDFSPGTRLRLSPHWRPIDPASGGIFHEQFTDGIFNGGILVARPASIDILSWWATACAYRCEKAPDEGLFVDQKYLDVVPVYFEGVDIIRHKGINVARWNRRYLERRTDPERGILVHGDPLICVHFSGSTVRLIDAGEDPVLLPVLRSYREELRREGVELPVHEAHSPRKDAPPKGSLLMRGLRRGTRIFRSVRSWIREIS